MRAARLVMLVGIVIGGASCGYLDRDIWVDDEVFEEELEFEGLSITGSGGSWGHGYACGGRGWSRRGIRRPALAHASTAADARETVIELSDEEILANTDVDVVDESLGRRPGLVEALYYEQKAARDRSIARVY